MAYPQDTTDELYRRGLYVVVKRSVPNPTLGTFDAGERSSCVSRRQKTMSPAQALVMMNDPTVLESARVLAERPDSIDALLGQGECALRTGDFEDARDCFETACALDPGSVPALCALARLLRSTGDAAGAKAHPGAPARGRAQAIHEDAAHAGGGQQR